MDTQGLIAAIEHNQWSIVVALVLLALVALAGDVVARAGVTGRALQLVSLARGYVGGVCAALLVGALWWHALIVGCAATGVSAGARDLVVDLVRWIIRRRNAVAGATVALLATVVSAGCGAQHVPTPEDCQAERRIVTALDGVVDVVDVALPPEVEGRDEALAYSREGVGLGVAAVDACEALRDEAPWLRWVGVALKVVRGLVSILRLAHVDIPGPLGELLDLLVERRPPAAPLEGVAADDVRPARW